MSNWWIKIKNWFYDHGCTWCCSRSFDDEEEFFSAEEMQAIQNGVAVADEKKTAVVKAVPADANS